MSSKHCAKCKHRGSDICRNCSKNTSRSVADIPPLDPSVSVDMTKVTKGLDASEIEEFFRNWLHLPSRLRDVFVALYTNHFNLSKAAIKLQIGVHQVSYARDALKEHEYFGQFFPE